MLGRFVVGALSFCGILLCQLVPQGVAQQLFGGDPLDGDNYLYHVFMRLDEHEPYHLHTGIDIAGEEGDWVYAPLAAGDSAEVRDLSYTDNFVTLQVPWERQNGKYVCCILLHVHPYVEVGDIVYSGSIVGYLDHHQHLHEEILMKDEEEPDFEDRHLVNPLDFANENADWINDEQNPTLSVDLVEEGGGYIWKVYAQDGHELGAQDDDDDGVYSLYLVVNDSIVDAIVFGGFAGRDGGFPPDWQDFYCEYNIDRLCYRLSWQPAAGESLLSWEVRVYDHSGRYAYEDGELHGCLGNCDPPTWSCIKMCYGGGTVADGTNWPGPKGCTETEGGTICHPEGVLGKMGGYDVYWGNFDPEAWEYRVWEGEGDESSYQEVGSKPPSGAFRKVRRRELSDSLTYYYKVASLDSTLREEVPCAARGSITGVGQVRLSGEGLCTALDTANGVLFIGEAGGIIEVVDVSSSENPLVIASHDLADLGLWDNLFDDPCAIQYDGYLWVICGNKGLAVFSFENKYTVMELACRYDVPGRDAELRRDYSGDYVYYTTQSLELEVLSLEEEGSGSLTLTKCGEYTYDCPGGFEVYDSYILRSQGDWNLYVSGDSVWDIKGCEIHTPLLQVVDISTPCDPVFMNNWSVSPGFGVGGFSVEIQARCGDYLFAAPYRCYGYWDAWNVVIDISDPQFPVAIAQWENQLFIYRWCEHRCRIAGSGNRFYSMAYTPVHYPSPSRYGEWARWGGLEVFTICAGGTQVYAGAVADTGFDAAGDTTLIATSITAAAGKLYVTYASAPDTDSVEDPPFNRLKVYVDSWTPEEASGVLYDATSGLGEVQVSLAGPNPFLGETAIVVSVADHVLMRLGVYDVAGRLVFLVTDAPYAPGTYRFRWDGTNQSGEPVAPGIYFLHVRCGAFAATRKVILLR